MSFPWLTTLALVPIIGALATFSLRGRTAKQVGMSFAGVTAALGVVVFFLAGGANNLSEQVMWIRPIGAWYALNVDGMGKVLVLLTVLLVPVVLAYEWNLDARTAEVDTAAGRTVARPQARWDAALFVPLVLLLEGLTLYVFLAADVLLFYIFFEATLVPMYFLIAGWGGPNRSRAAIKFLLFSLAGGLILLFAVIGVYAVSARSGPGTFLLADLLKMQFGGAMGRWLFIGFFIAFAIKAPMVPVHTWLPDTTAQATPGTSTLLVSTLDKIGTFGMIRFCLGLFPEASKWATPVVLGLAVLSVLYGALMAIGSANLLRLVAFTSISHFGFMVLGIFSMTSQALSGTIFYMLAHGLSAAALFLVVGMMIDRRGSADVYAYGGAEKVAPVLAGVFLMAGLATLGLPGMANFVGEFLIMAGSWQRNLVYVAVAVVGTVLAAIYVLLAYQRTMTGPVTPQTREHITTDLGTREKAVIAPLLVLLLLFGFWPKPMLDVVGSTAKDTMAQVAMTDPAPQVGVK